MNEVLKRIREVGIAPVVALPSADDAVPMARALLDGGLPAAKFFPAESMGGLKMLKGLAAPFPPMEFMVTGGLSLANMGAYLAWDRVLAVGGSWMVEKNLVAAGGFDEIAALAEEAVREARNYRE
ncbi:hypothetical protein LF599_02705 [Pseudodesulfovibrio thermohalotolerans]|uniref:hypothetical protein n=1 Tax=Pseudodesulfovibrio thermohalotolerans TaxID=2880651 RepID=UPI00244308B1|nr:hypothetical protein [Pseudodesulfovibrio thermohalotolerans]WFS63088.1 hypothetical protein LF599_02705 [Pseudodesulfovibrio thermohalotolerans]